MNTCLKVAVLGAGNAGQAFAGWLASQGCEVRITDLLPNVLQQMASIREIELTGMLTCRGKVKVVADPQECVKDAELIILATAAPGHCPIMDKVAPALQDGQILMVQPGYWSHATIPHHLAQMGYRPNLVYVQTESLIYTCRAMSPGHVQMNYIKRKMGFAVKPSPRAAHASRLMTQFWPQLQERSNVLEVSLDNVNFTMHPTIALLNTARIEDHSSPWYFYRQGVGPGTIELVHQVDNERMALGRALGLNLTSTYDMLKNYYSVPEAHDLLTQIKLNPGYEEIAAPERLNYRYFQEDIPFGMIPMLRLAQTAGVRMPLTESIVNLGCALLGCDFYKMGLTLEDLEWGKAS